jgi:hypothetical protein
MTHCILTTDIELAKKLLTAARPDSAIIAALVQRGIDSASAAQLVTDLRNGRQVIPQIPAGMEAPSKRRSRSRREHRSSEQPSAPASAEATPRREHAHEHHSHSRKESSNFWLLAAVPICFVAVIIGILVSKFHRTPEEEPSNKLQPAASAHEMTPAAATAPKTAAPGSPAQSAAGKKGPDSGQLPTAGVSNVPPPQTR